MQQKVPGVLFGDFSEADAAYFNNTIYVGSAAWEPFDQQIIAYFNWKLTIVNLSGEDELLDLVVDKYARKEPVLFYFWKPHPLHDALDLVKIQLKDAGTSCTQYELTF